MRRLTVVAVVALIAAIASVAVPGPVGSRGINPLHTPSVDDFALVQVDLPVRGPAMTIQPLDPAARSDGNLDRDSTMLEPDTRREPPQARPAAAQRDPDAGVIRKALPKPKAPVATSAGGSWRLDRNVSWYGPGFYGNRTACGLALTTTLIGVAHRTLPCGTRVTFKNPANGRVVTAPVVDRGPYVAGRTWDLTGGLCVKLDHCYTGSLHWRFASGG